MKSTVAELPDEKTQKAINQQDNEKPNAYLDSVNNADKEDLETFSGDIAFLRKLENINLKINSKHFYASKDLRTCNNCGTVMDVDKRFVADEV